MPSSTRPLHPSGAANSFSLRKTNPSVRNIAVLDWGPTNLAFVRPRELVRLRCKEEQNFLPKKQVRYALSKFRDLNKCVTNLQNCFNFTYKESVGFFNGATCECRVRREHESIVEKLRLWLSHANADAVVWLDYDKPNFVTRLLMREYSASPFSAQHLAFEVSAIAGEMGLAANGRVSAAGAMGLLGVGGGFGSGSAGAGFGGTGGFVAETSSGALQLLGGGGEDGGPRDNAGSASGDGLPAASGGQAPGGFDAPQATGVDVSAATKGRSGGAKKTVFLGNINAAPLDGSHVHLPTLLAAAGTSTAGGSSSSADAAARSHKYNMGTSRSSKKKPSLRCLVPILRHRYGREYVDYSARIVQQAEASFKSGRKSTVVFDPGHSLLDRKLGPASGFVSAESKRKISVFHGDNVHGGIILPGEFYQHGLPGGGPAGPGGGGFSSAIAPSRRGSVFDHVGANRRQSVAQLMRKESCRFGEDDNSTKDQHAISHASSLRFAFLNPTLSRKDSRVFGGEQQGERSHASLLRKDSFLTRKDSSMLGGFSRKASAMFGGAEFNDEVEQGVVQSAANSQNQAIAHQNPNIQKLLRRKESSVLDEHALTGSGKQVVRSEKDTYVVLQQDDRSAAAEQQVAARRRSTLVLGGGRASFSMPAGGGDPMQIVVVPGRRQSARLSIVDNKPRSSMAFLLEDIDERRVLGSKDPSGLYNSHGGENENGGGNINSGIAPGMARPHGRPSFLRRRSTLRFGERDGDNTKEGGDGSAPKRGGMKVLHRKASEISDVGAIRNVGTIARVFDTIGGGRDANKDKNISVQKITLEAPKRDKDDHDSDEPVSPAELLRSILAMEEEEGGGSFGSGANGGTRGAGKTSVTGGVDGAISPTGSRSLGLGKTLSGGGGGKVDKDGNAIIERQSSGKKKGAHGLWKAAATAARITVGMKIMSTKSKKKKKVGGAGAGGAAYHLCTNL
eukprot:g9424.t1